MNKKLLKKIYFLLFFILLFVFITTSFAAADADGEILKIRELKKPLTLNPIHAVDNISKKISEQIFENLVIINKQGKVEPYLAESWEIKDDGKLIVIKLRDDIYFHEKIKKDINTKNGGRKVNAEDWKWSLNYLASPENKSTYAKILDNIEGFNEYISGKKEEIEGIKIKDEFTLEFILKEPNALFLYKLAHSAVVVMPKEDIQNNNLNWDLNPVGTGAFRFHYLDKNSVSLLKNINYWDHEADKKLPFLDKINIYFADSDNNTPKNYSMFKLSSEEYSKYSNDNNLPNNYDLLQFSGAEIYYYGLYFRNNNNEKDTNNYNTESRLLLNQLIDRRKLIDSIESANYMPIGKNISIFNDNIVLSEGRVNNLEEKSKSIFDSKVKLIINNKELNVKIAEEIQSQLLNYDIEIAISKLNWVNYIEEISSNRGDYDLFFLRYRANNIFDFLKDNFYSDMDEQKDNYYNYNNSRLNYLLDYLEIETDKEKRDRALEIINNIIKTDLPAFYLMQSAETYLVENKVKYIDKFNNYNNSFYKYLYLEK